MSAPRPKRAIVVDTSHHAYDICKAMRINPATRYNEEWHIIVAGQSMAGHRFETIFVTESVDRAAYAAAEFQGNEHPHAWLAELGLRLEAGGQLVRL